VGIQLLEDPLDVAADGVDADTERVGDAAAKTLQGEFSRSGPSDTAPEVEEKLLAAFRGMAPDEKLRKVSAMNRAVEAMAAARLRRQYGPDLSESELELRLAALRLDRELMIAAFGWDPEERGY
jgi:hypothetical protein